MKPAALILMTLSLVSCFSSVTSSVQCAAGPSCPDGRTCVEGWCVAAEGDGPVVRDAAADQRPAQPGCARGGDIPLGSRAVACAGTFDHGGAAALCGAGWAPCLEATNVDLGKCNALSGFFIADVPGAWGNNYMAPLCRRTDSTINRNERPMFFGCGRTGVYSFLADNPCKGFQRSLECVTVNSKWFCNNFMQPQYLTNAKNTEPADGILCCLP